MADDFGDDDLSDKVEMVALMGVSIRLNRGLADDEIRRQVVAVAVEAIEDHCESPYEAEWYVAVVQRTVDRVLAERDRADAAEAELAGHGVRIEMMGEGAG